MFRLNIMLSFFITERYMFTLQDWLQEYARMYNYSAALIPYTSMLNSKPEGSFVFTDIERIHSKPTLLQKAINYSNYLEEKGLKVFNKPSKAKNRYDLQACLNNSFKTYRLNDDLTHIRFPVFVRREYDHKLFSHLIYDKQSLNEVLARFEKLGTSPLIIEFIDVKDEEGVYRKYSAYNIAGRIIPRHLFFSKFWLQKEPDILSEDYIREELDYVKNNPHKNELLRIFNTACINYGRIDYGFYKGQLQVWEINTNPHLRLQPKSGCPQRADTFEITADAINQSFRELS